MKLWFFDLFHILCCPGAKLPNFQVLAQAVAENLRNNPIQLPVDAPPPGNAQAPAAQAPGNPAPPPDNPAPAVDAPPPGNAQAPAAQAPGNPPPPPGIGI